MTPTPLSIPSVNKSTAQKLIRALLSSGGITRGELAKACGVSAMTAGKVVSAMCLAGYAIAENEITKHGRTSEFIYPSERFTFLVFDILEHSMSADVFDARENIIFSYNQQRNPSIDAGTDAKMFISLVEEQLKDTDSKNNAFRLSALLYHQSTELDTDAFTMGNIKIFKERSVATASYVGELYPAECIAFVGAEEDADIMLVSKGARIHSKGKPRRQRSKGVISELDMLENLATRLCGLFEFLIPNKVIIDSRSLHISRRFSSELCEILCSRTSMQKEELPEFVTNDGIAFPSRAVIGQLIDIYAEIISAN